MSAFSIENIGTFELGATVATLADGALEAVSQVSAQPSYSRICHNTTPPMCIGIDDDMLSYERALEATARYAMAGPTSHCGPQTIQYSCPIFIDGGAN